MTTTAQLNTMTDRELVAYWNIMQFPGMVIGSKTTEHLPIVDELLTERGIAHERGKFTDATEATREPRLKTYRLPQTFYHDHVSRDLPEQGISSLVSANQRFAYVEMDADAYDDLLSDAHHYSDPGIAADMDLPSLASSARRTVAALVDQRRPS